MKQAQTEMDWVAAKTHFDTIRGYYQDEEGKPVGNYQIMDLRLTFDPLARRFNAGERSAELYAEMMEVQ